MKRPGKEAALEVLSTMTAENMPGRDDTATVLPDRMLTLAEKELLVEIHKQGGIDTNLKIYRNRHKVIMLDVLKRAGLITKEAGIVRVTAVAEAKLSAASSTAEGPVDPAEQGSNRPRSAHESVFNLLEGSTVYPMVIGSFEEAILLTRHKSWLLFHTVSILITKLRAENITHTIDGIAVDEPNLLAVLIDMKPGFHDDLHG